MRSEVLSHPRKISGHIVIALIPFFLGRLVSYSFWIFSAAAAGRKFDLDLDLDDGVSAAGVYFVVTQILLLPALYIFIKLDWRALFAGKGLRWRAGRTHHAETGRPKRLAALGLLPDGIDFDRREKRAAQAAELP
jgi:hypothetical protein